MPPPKRKVNSMRKKMRWANNFVVDLLNSLQTQIKFEFSFAIRIPGVLGFWGFGEIGRAHV